MTRREVDDSRGVTKAEYDTYLLIDFTKATDSFKQTFFDTRSDIRRFFLYLSAEFGAELRGRESLVIFDEVQAFPQAREFLKRLVADGRYDYIETASLISIKENVKDILIPSEELRMMRPMDFEEFLWALGAEALAIMIWNAFEKQQSLPDSLHRKAERLWGEYMLVAGCPRLLRLTWMDATWCLPTMQRGSSLTCIDFITFFSQR